MLGDRLELMTLKVFCNLIDPVALCLYVLPWTLGARRVLGLAVLGEGCSNMLGIQLLAQQLSSFCRLSCLLHAPSLRAVSHDHIPLVTLQVA